MAKWTGLFRVEVKNEQAFGLLKVEVKDEQEFGLALLTVVVKNGQEFGLLNWTIESWSERWREIDIVIDIHTITNIKIEFLSTMAFHRWHF